MKAFIAKSPIGVFAFDEYGNLLYFEPFSKDSAEALKQFEAFDINSLKPKLHGYAVFENKKAYGFLRKNFRILLKDSGFSDKEFNKFLNEFALTLSQKRLINAIGRDKLLIQASNAIEDLAKTGNQLSMRLAEWFGLHYPEMKTSHNELIEKIEKYGARDNWPELVTSTGIELIKDDEEILRSFASMVRFLQEEKSKLEKYVKSEIRLFMPNFSALIDPLLAARILAAAGSLEKLAKSSASSIQLIGSEKALFRHLRKQGKAPKYGLIFNSAWIQNAPDTKRGKVARVLAAKLMLAARIDFYAKRDEAAKMKKELEEEINKTLKGE